MKVLTAQEIRKIEQACEGIGISTDTLMENAGRAVAEEVRRILGFAGRHNILLLIGPGNNGGDGLVAARHLHDWGAKVSLYLCGHRAEGNANLGLALERGIPCIDAARDEGLTQLDEMVASADAVVDALFGTGRSRPLSGLFKRTLKQVALAKAKRRQLKIIALDLSSGLSADGAAADPACLYADYTVTLGFAKRGLFSPVGAERSGQVTIADIGIPSQLAAEVATELITAERARQLLPQRRSVSHKGSFGRVLVIAGSINYIGAAYLACSGAIRVGAGLVTLATARSLQPILAARMAEVTYLPLAEDEPGIISSGAAVAVLNEMDNYDVLLIGCGLGQAESTAGFIKAVLAALKPPSPKLVLDADALNILAKTADWWRGLSSDIILTPHPGEMSRLSGLKPDEVQQDRVGVARKYAGKWHKTLVLKGAHTVIAAPDGECRINPVANAGLASAGTGDVLAGVIAGLLAQGLSLFAAATLGVYLHAQAGELVRASLGDAGMVASDLLPVLPLAIKKLKESQIKE